MIQLVNKSQVRGFFPSALCKDESKFTSEKNITGIVRAVVDNNSYIISYNQPTCEFVIHGYYFKIDLPQEGNDLWANIIIDESGRIIGYDTDGGVTTEIYSTGTDPVFRGVVFDSSKLSNPNSEIYEVYSLKLMNQGVIIEEAFKKFNVDSLPIGTGENDIAAGNHTHGNISNDGKISEEVVIESGDKLIISDNSDGENLASSTIAFGTNTTMFLRNDGTWKTPAGTFSLQHATDSTLGGIKTGYGENGSNYAVKLSDDKAYVTVPWTDTKYSLPVASSEVLGGIKIGYTTNNTNRNYAVQLSDGNGKAYVNVPWENTTYGVATTSTEGLMSAADKTKLTNIAAGAEVNVQANWTETNNNSDAFIKNKPTIPTAGTGLTLNNGVLNHTNSITAVLTKKIYPITIDAQGHITAVGPGGYEDVNGIRSHLGNQNQQFYNISTSNSDRGLSGGTIVKLNTPNTTAFRGSNIITGNPGWDGVKISVPGTYKIWGSLYFDSLSTDVTDYGIYVYYGDQELGGILYPKPTGRTFSGALNFNAIIEEISPSDSKTLTVIARLRGSGTGRIHLDSTMTEFYIERIA